MRSLSFLQLHGWRGEMGGLPLSQQTQGQGHMVAWSHDHSPQGEGWGGEGHVIMAFSHRWPASILFIIVVVISYGKDSSPPCLLKGLFLMGMLWRGIHDAIGWERLAVR